MDAETKRETLAAKAPATQTPIEKMDGNEIALAFCRECLGWKDAKIVATKYENKIYLFDKIKGWISLDFQGLESVLQAVREWLSAMDADLCSSAELALLSASSIIASRSLRAVRKAAASRSI